MLGNYVAGRVFVFIDAENLFYSQRVLGWRISYAKLLAYFRKECGPGVQCLVYAGFDPNNMKQLRFLESLRKNGYLLRTKEIKHIRSDSGDRWKSNLDIELALGMIDHLDAYETAVLLSGDSDFAPVLDRLRARGKQIVVISTRKHIARELIARAKFIELRKLRSEIEWP